MFRFTHRSNVFQFRNVTQVEHVHSSRALDPTEVIRRPAMLLGNTRAFLCSYYRWLYRPLLFCSQFLPYISYSTRQWKVLRQDKKTSRRRVEPEKYSQPGFLTRKQIRFKNEIIMSRWNCGDALVNPCGYISCKLWEIFWNCFINLKFSWIYIKILVKIGNKLTLISVFKKNCKLITIFP